MIKVLPYTLLFVACSASATESTYICTLPDLGQGVARPRFSATITVSCRPQSTNSETRCNGTLKLSAISQAWPIEKSGCSFPSLEKYVEIAGSDKGGEIVLGPKQENECGYVLFVSKNTGAGFSLLSPRESYKVFGHPPYVATCKTVSSNKALQATPKSGAPEH